MVPVLEVASGVLLCTILLVIILLFYRPRNPKEPEFVGPGLRINISMLTDTASCKPLQHLHDLSLSVKGFGKTAYGAVFQMYMMSKHYVVVTDYNVARLVMVGDSSRGLQEGEKTKLARSFDLFKSFGTIFSSLTSDNHRQKTRKFLAPCFSFSNLKYTFEVMLRSLLKCRNKLAAYAEANKEFDLNDVMARLTFDIITESAFGINWDVQSDDVVSDGNVFLHETTIRLRESAQRAYNPLRKYCFWLEAYKRHATAVSRIVSVLRKVVSDYRLRNSDDILKTDQSIMGHLMRHDYASEDRRVGDMNTFLGAGHETTAHSLTMLIIALCKHPETLHMLQDELDEAIPSSAIDNPDQYPSIAAIRALPYLSGCLQEAMRLYPVTGSGSRRVLVNDIEYEGILIPKGSTCTMAYYSMFRQPWIDRAEEFIPERWGPSNPQLKELKAMLMPFALGSRNCIGQNLAKVELCMIASYLLRYFRFELLCDPTYEVFLTMKATNVRMKVQNRP